MSTRVIQLFHNCADESGLEYIIIGGFAASYWGTPRFTADIDFVVELGSLELVKQVMTKLGYQLGFLHPKESFAHFNSTNDSNFRIDFMLVNSDTWSKLFQEIKYVDLGFGKDSPLVSPIHLIAMKLHAAKQNDRTEYFKDLNDIVEIMLNQEISFDSLASDGMLERYGTKTTLDELQRIYQVKKDR